jgi:hypothetical protein
MSEIIYKASNLYVENGFVRNPNRYYLEEYFQQLPSLTSIDTVTQASNHATAVTLNANAGIIQLAAVALNATTNAEFTFTNNVIKSTSQILLTMQDENETDNVQLTCAVHTIGNGSCIITLVNSHSSGNSSVIASKIHFKIINKPINNNFFTLGTNNTDSSVAFATTRAGITLTTTTADNDQVILAPNLDTNATAWSGIKWGTENQVEWEGAISVANITNVSFWAGLKLTNTPLLATDDNQAYFFFNTDDSTVGTITTNANLHFVYSIAGTDYTTNLGIEVAADTIYKLRISIDSDRKLTVFVGQVSSASVVTNMTQYGLTQTAGTLGILEADTTQRGLALTDDINLIPYIGVETVTGAKILTVYYEKISRVLFE